MHRQLTDRGRMAVASVRRVTPRSGYDAGMARSHLVLGFGALLALALALAVWLLPARESLPRPAAATAAASAAAAAAVRGEGAASMPTPGESGAEALLRREATLAGPAAGSAADAGPQVQVRVLGPDGKALAGLTVRYLLPQEAGKGLDDAGRTEMARLRFDGEAMLQRFGSEAVTDARGIARWPRREVESSWWQVGARHGEDWGETWIPSKAAADEVHELRLSADRSLAIRVLDAQGQPAAGVPLAASYRRGGEGSNQGIAGAQELGVTDADGNAVARHLQVWSYLVDARGFVLPILVRPRLPGVEVGHEVDAAMPPRDPVVLYLPPTGVVEVTVRDGLGEPAAKGTKVTILPEPRDEDGRKAWTAAADDHGVCVFPRVGLGQQWRVILQGEQRQELVFSGPRAGGEVVRVVLQPETTPVLTGQLSADGKPAAKARFLLISAEGAPAREPTETGDDGRFRIVASNGAWLGKHLTTVTCRGVDARGQYDGRVASWNGDLLLRAGEHDLGVVTFVEEPIVVAGRLLTTSGTLGQRQPGVWVEAATGDAEKPWRAVSLSRRLQPDGTFECRGQAPNAPLRLQVWTKGAWLPVPPVRFGVGERFLQVKLEQGGSVKASVVAGSYEIGFCLQPLLVPVTPVLPPAGGIFVRYGVETDPMVPLQHEIVRDHPLEEGFTWPAVAPGRYRLQVRTRTVPTVLLEIADVVVVDGECNEEPRLQHLQVPGLRFLKLTLPQAQSILAEQQKRPSGIGGAGVVFVLEGDTPTDQCMQVDGLVFFASARPLDLLVRLIGYRDRIVRGLFEDQTIELEPGIAVELRADALELPPGGTLSLMLSPIDDALTAAKSWIYSPAAGGSSADSIYRTSAVAAKFADGSARFALPAPGRYRVTAQLQSGDGKPQTVAVEPGEVAVGDSGGSFAVHVALPK